MRRKIRKWWISYSGYLYMHKYRCQGNKYKWWENLLLRVMSKTAASNET